MRSNLTHADSKRNGIKQKIARNFHDVYDTLASEARSQRQTQNKFYLYVGMTCSPKIQSIAISVDRLKAFDIVSAEIEQDIISR